MINILYCGNKKVFGDHFMSVISMADKTKEPLNIIALTIYVPDVEPKGRPWTKDHETLLDAQVKLRNPKSSYRVIDATPQFIEAKLTSGKNLNSMFSIYSNIRLISDKIAEVPDKVIYMDNDTILNNDIKEFWDIDISNYEVGVIKDDFRPFWSKYFNAGVMLLNMKKIRESELFSRAVYLVRNKKMLYMDQDALNRLTRKTKKMLPRKFNAKSKWYPKIVIHHICGVREGKIMFIGKWWNRIKPQNIAMIRTKLPQYDKYYDLLEEQIKKTPDLFVLSNTALK